jgi:hypothetical protein
MTTKNEKIREAVAAMKAGQGRCISRVGPGRNEDMVEVRLEDFVALHEAAALPEDEPAPTREAHALIRAVMDFAHEQYRLRAEVNAGAEGHTYENGWCDALAGVLEVMGLDSSALRAPAPSAPTTDRAAKVAAWTAAHHGTCSTYRDHPTFTRCDCGAAQPADEGTDG